MARKRTRRRTNEGREEALTLRLQGKSYREIEAALGISKSTLSGWLSDVPLSEEQRLALLARSAEAGRNRGIAVRALRLRREEQTKAECAAQISDLTDRELFFAGLAIYWAEGTKNKPWRSETVQFINSDPDVIRVFLAWLRLLGIGAGRLSFRLTIHETADEALARQYWADLVGVDSSSFGRTTLKRHNPKTRRRNNGVDYHGCLVIYVRRSTELLRRITGWWHGLALEVGAGAVRGGRSDGGVVPQAG